MKIYSESSRTTCFQWLVIFVMTCIFIMVVLLIRVTWSFSSQLCSSFFPRFALPSWRWYWRPLWMCKTSTYVCQNRALCSKQLILSFHLAHQRKRKENKIRSKFQHSYRSPLHLILEYLNPFDCETLKVIFFLLFLFFFLYHRYNAKASIIYWSFQFAFISQFTRSTSINNRLQPRDSEIPRMLITFFLGIISS